MNGALVVVADSSAIMKEDIYYIRYKGHPFKYIKSEHPRRSDWMVGFYKNDDQDAIYKMMTEFLRAFAFRNNLRIRLSSGISALRLNETCIKEINIGSREYKSIEACSNMPGFYFVSSVDSAEKSELLRLYTEADANNSLFFKFLFFWHTLVYPSNKDSEAESYINEYISAGLLSPDDSSLDYLKSSGVFGDFDMDNPGTHFRGKIRNAIAHVVLNGAQRTNLSIDSLEQYRHINAANSILKKVARHKLSNEFKLAEDADSTIFQTFQP